MNIVVDASVAIKWFVREKLRDAARRLLNGGDDLHAPDLLVAEVANIAWKKAIRSEITAAHARHIASACAAGVPALLPSRNLVYRAMDLAITLNHPVYDCLYVACAEVVSGVLVTADEKLVSAARAADAGLPIRLLTEAADTSA